MRVRFVLDFTESLGSGSFATYLAGLTYDLDEALAAKAIESNAVESSATESSGPESVPSNMITNADGFASVTEPEVGEEFNNG